MNVPFVDLKAQYAAIGAEVDRAIHKVMADADLILGKDVEQFEKEFAAYCGAKYAVGLDSGISALELSMRALGIGAGDEVITVSHTFIATASSISFTGARPVLVEIEPDTYNLDPNRIAAAITRRTKAIVPVHLYGQCADMDAINAIAAKNGLKVIEDACQAHGAIYKNRRAGALGHAGCFSFYPAKNLGGYGDGGMLVTDDLELAEKVSMLRNYGQREKYHHLFLAYNRRLDTIQAAALRVKLKHLDAWNAARRQAAALYDQLLAGVKSVVIPKIAADRTSVHHLYVMQHPQRDKLLTFLKDHGVQAGLHYPIPVHLQPCYEDLKIPRGALPISESLASRCISLPIFPEITPEQVRYVADLVAQSVKA